MFLGKIPTKKSLSHINAGRARTEYSTHKRRRADGDRIEGVGKDLAE